MQNVFPLDSMYQCPEVILYGNCEILGLAIGRDNKNDCSFLIFLECRLYIVEVSS